MTGLSHKAGHSYSATPFANVKQNDKATNQQDGTTIYYRSDVKFSGWVIFAGCNGAWC